MSVQKGLSKSSEIIKNICILRVHHILRVTSVYYVYTCAFGNFCNNCFIALERSTLCEFSKKALDF